MRANDRLEYTDPSRGSDYREISSSGLENDVRLVTVTLEQLHELYDGVTSLTREQVAELSSLIKAGEAAHERLHSDDTVFDPELAEVVRAGDFARETLTLANMGLVRMVVNRRMAGMNNSPEARSYCDDLIQEGYIALDKLTREFDPSRGFTFSTFAVRALSLKIMAASWRQRRGFRVADHVREDDVTIYRAKTQLSVELQREPTLDEIAELTGLSVQRIDDVHMYMKPTVSLDTPLSTEDSDGLTLLNVVAEKPQVVGIDDEIHQGTSNDAQVEKLIGYLTANEYKIIRGMYGFDGPLKNADDLAAEMGIARESVKRTFERAKKRIRLLSYMDDDGNLIVSDSRDKAIAS